MSLSTLHPPADARRYNTFSILYPLGAGSEAFLMASVLPPLRTLPAALSSLVKHQQKTGILDVIKRTLTGTGAVRGWGAYELWVAYLFVIWWPGTSIPSDAMSQRLCSSFSPLCNVHAYDRLATKSVGQGQDPWRCAGIAGEEEAVSGKKKNVGEEQDEGVFLGLEESDA